MVIELYVYLMLHYLFRSAFELWGEGQTHSELKTSLLNYPSERMVCDAKVCSAAIFFECITFINNSDVLNNCLYCCISLQSPFMHKDSTYRINVYTFNKTLEFADRIKRIDVSV